VEGGEERSSSPASVRTHVSRATEGPLLVCQHPAEATIVAEFRRYLLHERGLAPSTLLNYVPVAEQFLAERFHNRAPDFAVLRAPHVTGFVMRHAHQLSPVRAGLMVTALRSFFRYLRHRGEIATDLAGCVPRSPTGRFPRFRGFCQLLQWSGF
jgi:site-specific recombinase XerC